MPYELSDLIVDRVDLVDAGANSAAFITLYKRKEQTNAMTFEEVVAKLSPEEATAIAAQVSLFEKRATDAEDALRVAKAAEKPAGTTDEEVLKGLPEEARNLLTKMKQQKELAEEALRKSKEAEETAEAVAKAAKLKALPVQQDVLVELIKKSPAELVDTLESIAKAMESTVLTELGKSSHEHGSTTSEEAWSKIDAKADAIAKSKSITKQKAIAQVINDDPALYKEYLQGGAN